MDVIQAYKDALNAFYEAGVRYLQLDDVHIADFLRRTIPFNDEDRIQGKQLIDLALRSR